MNELGDRLREGQLALLKHRRGCELDEREEAILSSLTVREVNEALNSLPPLPRRYRLYSGTAVQLEQSVLERFLALLRQPSQPSTPQVARQAGRVLEVLSLIVPRRLADEDIGDAIEGISKAVFAGRPRWQLWLKVATTVFWVLLNSLREITSAVRGRASVKP